MSRSEPPVVLARESPFGIEELFFSTTDLKGRIRSGNRVFERTAGYGREELVGRPHNLIRHPDMPRGVFQALWDTIQAGEPFAGYVKNRAKDGSFYWVMALVVATGDGYLSIRLKPTTERFHAAQQLYRDLLEIEQAIETTTEQGAKRAAIEASMAELAARLRALGHDSYGHFAHEALVAEVTAREAALTGRDRVPGLLTDNRDLVGALDACRELSHFLSGMVADLANYRTLAGSMGAWSHTLATLAASTRLFALNATVAAQRLGSEGATIGAVAGLLRTHFDTLGHIVTDAVGLIDTAVATIARMEFQIATAKLLTETAVVFLRELLAGEPTPEAVADLGLLTATLVPAVTGLLATQERLTTQLRDIDHHSALVTRELDSVRALEINGRIESARLRDPGGIGDLLIEIARRVREARGDLGRTGTGGLRTIERAVVNDVHDRLDVLQRSVHALAA